MDLPDELVNEIITFALSSSNPFAALNLASTCRRYEPRRHHLYPKLLPFVYNNRDLKADFIRALSRKHELGIRYMLKYMELDVGLRLALKFKHDLSIDYFVQEATILGRFFDRKFIYYAYKARREDILDQIELYEEPGVSSDTYKYYGLVASDRGHLMYGHKIPKREIKLTRALALRYGIEKATDHHFHAGKSYSSEEYRKLYRYAKALIMSHRNEFLDNCLRAINKYTQMLKKIHPDLQHEERHENLYDECGCLYEAARKHNNDVAYVILARNNIERFGPFPKYKIGDGFDPRYDLKISYFHPFLYHCNTALTFKELEYILQYVVDGRDRAIKRVYNDLASYPNKHCINLIIAYPDVLDCDKVLKMYREMAKAIAKFRARWETENPLRY